jgi:hypothetical protein
MVIEAELPEGGLRFSGQESSSVALVITEVPVK